jgi:hypothetical protein
MTACWALLCLTAFSAATATDDSRNYDRRIAAKMPARLVAQFKEAMRGYLVTLSKMQTQMGAGDYLAASTTAEETLGETAHAKLQALRPVPELVKYLPPGMRAMGDTLHTAASQFALASKQAATGGDTGKAWTAMAKILDSCVACHAAYRLKPSEP